MYTKLILFLSLSITNISLGQIAINRNLDIELSEDSLTAITIKKSLEFFLEEAQNGTYSNEYVDSNHLQQNEFFFRKLTGIGKNSIHTFNSPNVLKSYNSDHENYMVTVAFTGIKNDVPFVYQITEFLAKPYKDHYRFYCPFTENTKDFKTKTFDNVTYYYSGDINETKAREFVEFKNRLSDLTKTPKSNLDYYCFQSLDELLKSYGFLFSARQCNFLCYDLGFMDQNAQAYITGMANENYVFEYIVNYFYYNLPNNEEMYDAFALGIATYYGGYATSYDSVDELKEDFRNELKQNPDIDFLEEFKKGRKSSINRHFSYYVMCAFLCEEVMRKKGFDDTMTLLYSGDKGELFFKNLHKVMGIDESNFHKTILRLIEA